MNIVHLVVVETLSTFWNLEEPFKNSAHFSLILGTKILVKIGTQHMGQQCVGLVLFICLFVYMRRFPNML